MMTQLGRAPKQNVSQETVIVRWSFTLCLLIVWVVNISIEHFTLVIVKNGIGSWPFQSREHAMRISIVTPLLTLDSLYAFFYRVLFVHADRVLGTWLLSGRVYRTWHVRFESIGYCYCYLRHVRARAHAQCDYFVRDSVGAIPYQAYTRSNETSNE